MRILPRRLPPAATPLSWRQWRAGWRRDDAEAAFADEVAAYLGVPACFTAASGRTALFALLGALKASADSDRRREVLLPAYTCPALVRVILDAGLAPCPVDVNVDTMHFAPGELPAHLSREVLAVIHVHPFGLPMPVEPIVKAGHAAGAVVIEDAAQALGARYRGRPVGTWADFGLYSLGPGKALSLGGGGIVSANHPHTAALVAEAWEALSPPSGRHDAAAQLRLGLLSTAFRPTAWWLVTKFGAHRLGNREESWDYREQRLSGAQERVGRELLPELDAFNARRRQNAEALLRLPACARLLRPTLLTLGSEPTYLRLPLLAADEESRDRLHDAFWRAGIGAGKMYEKALDEIFPALATRPFPGAHALARRLLTLPTHHYLSERDFETIAQIVQEEAGQRRPAADLTLSG